MPVASDWSPTSTARGSHEIIDQALQVLMNLGHRGACGSDPDTGDGAGILIQTPHAFLKKETEEIGVELPEAGQYGVGMVFLPREADARARCEDAMRLAVEGEDLLLLGWRDIPVSPEAIGRLARENMPVIRQCFVGAPDGMDTDTLERKLYVARKEAERRVLELAAGEQTSEARRILRV